MALTGKQRGVRLSNTTMEKQCLQCNIVFKKQVNRSVKSFIENCKFCSKTCFSLFRVGKGLPESTKQNMRGRTPYNKKPNVTFNCEQCKVIVERLYNRRDASRFCSRKCANDFRNEGKSTEQKKIRMSLEYKQWRTSVFERDNYTCKGCGIRGGELNADHIKPFALFPEVRFDINNGSTLCVECHRKTDTYGGRISSYFKKTTWANAI